MSTEQAMEVNGLQLRRTDEGWQYLSEALALQVGDTVAIRGDRRLRMDGSCQYLPEQLVDGKYVKHTGHGGVWTGKVQKIQGDEALVSGCWRHVRMFEVYPPKS